MLYTLRSFLIVFLFAVSGCHSKSDEIVPAYNNYSFDSKVIEKLPEYDSLVMIILKKMPLVVKNIHDDNAYHAFRYMPRSKEPEVFRRLPPELEPDINPYITKLGKDFIYGFDVFKDSSIKIYIRRKTIDSTKVDMEENLSYFPAGNSKKQREYPIKDTVLNKHWQYWVRFDTDDLF